MKHNLTALRTVIRPIVSYGSANTTCVNRVSERDKPWSERDPSWEHLSVVA